MYFHFVSQLSPLMRMMVKAWEGWAKTVDSKLTRNVNIDFHLVTKICIKINKHNNCVMDFQFTPTRLECAKNLKAWVLRKLPFRVNMSTWKSIFVQTFTRFFLTTLHGSNSTLAARLYMLLIKVLFLKTKEKKRINCFWHTQRSFNTLMLLGITSHVF